jgi:hypothetical protein
MMRSAALLSIAISCLVATAAGADESCKSSPKLVGACFAVHGRLSVYNGAPALRIWPLGSNRLLGVRNPDGNPADVAVLPPSIYRFMPERGALPNLYGDYEVCPLTQEQPGRMQMVCIESAANLIAREKP